jgi:hypothetical protein
VFTDELIASIERGNALKADSRGCRGKEVQNPFETKFAQIKRRAGCPARPKL